MLHVHNFQSKTALIYENQHYSFSWLVNTSRALGQFLSQRKIRRLAFSLNNSPLNICLYLASWIGGIDCVAINPRLKAKELIEILKTLNTDRVYLESHQLDSEFIRFCQNHKLDYEIIEQPVAYLSAVMIDNGDKDESKSPITNDKPSKKTSITTHISSGSGGRYNLHRHSLKQILDYAYKRPFDLGLHKDDRLLMALSVNHACAFSYQLLPALVMGLTIVILPQFDPYAIKQALQTNSITSLCLLPTMYHFLIELCEEDPDFRYQLRFAMIAGDQLQPWLKKRFFQVFKTPLYNGIGMTEIYGYGQNTADEPINNKIRLFDDIEFKVTPFTPGSDTGELYLKSPMHPLDHDDDWLRTGDIAKKVDDDHILFLGRLKDIIIKGGSNISPLEIEARLADFPGMVENVIVGKKDRIWGQKLVACISMNKNHNKPSLAMIRDFLHDKIADYKMPDTLVFFDKIPKNITGKIDRHQLARIINEH